MTASQLAKNAQVSAAQVSRGASDTFNRFVEGESSSGRSKPIDESKADFWDSFGKPEEKPSSIGTSAMKGNGGGMGGGSVKKDEWDDW